MSLKKGQALLIIVFTLTFALFSLFLLLTPIKDKLIRIKEMESIYQAIANGEKGLETASLDIFKNINLNLQKQTTSYQTQNCGGMTYQGRTGTCQEIIFQPGSSLWSSQERFRADHFAFETVLNGEKVLTLKTISNGIVNKTVRTILLGSEQ